MVKLTSFNCLKSREKVEGHMHKPFWLFVFFFIVLLDFFAFIILTHNQMLGEKNHIHTKKDATTHLHLESSYPKQ
jgi:hypothetical protein